MSSWTDTLREGLLYRGRSGQWAWVFHRVSGLLTVLFIITHVLDSTLITFFPKLYERTIKLFKAPLAALAEIVLIGAVLYHAVNGLRVTVMDYRPEWWQHQKRATQVVHGVFALLYGPIAARMLISLFRNLGRNES
jgi:succinate dehydrogenase / fumarate reductase, cytochrome b subunit